MAETTGIEWTDATWNPIRGCSRVSEGCRNCYAERQAIRGAKNAYRGLVALTSAGPRWTGEVRLIEEHLADPLRWRQPRRIFVNSMSDLFHERVPDEWIDRIFAVMAEARWHTFQVLTKRPERMRDYLRALTYERLRTWINRAADGGEHRVGAYNLASMAAKVNRHRFVYDNDIRALRPRTGPPLLNVWLGVSVEDQATADARIPLLLQTPAAVRFVSYEPALDRVNFAGWLPIRWASADQRWERETEAPWVANRTGLDWFIVGGESGPGARPFDLAWARSVVAQCRAAEVPAFFKQAGSVPMMAEPEWRAMRPTPLLSALNRNRVPEGFVPLALRDRKGADMSEWPEDLRVREFPR